MSMCSIHNENFQSNSYSLPEGDRFLDTLLPASVPATLQLPTSKSSLELKRTRNRLAQRKHRQRKRASEGQGNSDDLRETRRRKLSTSNYGGLSAQGETQNSRPPSSGRDTERRDEPFGDTSVLGAPNRDHMSTIMGELDFSLLDGSNDVFNSNQATDTARTLSPQYLSALTGPNTAPPFGTKSKSPSLLEEQLRPQSFPESMLISCECNPQPTVSPTHFPAQWSDAGRRNQIPIPQQELPQERQNICHQFTLAGERDSRTDSTSVYFHNLSAPELEQQKWQSHGADLGRVKSPSSRASVFAPGELSSEPCIITPIDSAASSSTKSPLLSVPPTHSAASPDLETRFERILDVIEEAGFDSIDSMAACYYTTTFSQNSLCASAQSLSRRRHLRKFLEEVREGARSWNAKEAEGYQEGIIRSAESVYVEELGWLRDGGWGGMEGAKRRMESVRRIKEAVLDGETMSLLREEKRLLRERIPESWSLLTELARTAGLPQPQGSQAACVFLCMLMMK